MLVFKFGGASVKDADSVKNVRSIIRKFPNEKILIVVSAMGKMTNKFEELVTALLENNEEKRISILSEIHDYHFSIVSNLFDKKDRSAFDFF